jgi:hypothetical protein
MALADDSSKQKSYEIHHQQIKKMDNYGHLSCAKITSSSSFHDIIIISFMYSKAHP